MTNKSTFSFEKVFLFWEPDKQSIILLTDTVGSVLKMRRFLLKALLGSIHKNTFSFEEVFLFVKHPDNGYYSDLEKQGSLDRIISILYINIFLHFVGLIILLCVASFNECVCEPKKTFCFYYYFSLLIRA